jgi:hypothetical protein
MRNEEQVMNQPQQLENWTLSGKQAANLMQDIGESGPLAPSLDKALGGRESKIPSDIDTSQIVCLAKPEISLTVTLLAATNGRSLRVYGARGHNHLVGFTASDDGYNLSYPLQADHLTALVVNGLGLDQDVGALEFSTSLGGAELLALAGLVDALRQRELENMLARLPRHAGGVTIEEIYMRALDGLATGDIRWTSGLFVQLVQGLPDLSEEILESGLEGLQKLGWVTDSSGGNWDAATSFAVGCSHLQLPLAGVLVKLARLEGSEVAETDFVLLRMFGSIWLCQAKDKAYEFASVAADKATSNLISIIDGFAAQVSVPESNQVTTEQVKETATESPSSNSAEDASTVAKFCIQCGSQVDAKAKFCTACGAAITGS